ncbi:MAG: type III-B CRISPR-associated protein Cas10/Cmr2 [Nitrospira sp.]|nr:type III-B CRISPR-associated protein Cas10/Cmr2 [Nitrospira sp.]
MSELLHFSIGPVQEFIGQSRRTRDLWVSSYLLSYLVGRSMAAVVALDPERNQIQLPHITLRDLHAYQDGAADELPSHATLPNRFIARVSDGRAAGKHAREALHSSWQRMARHVWDEYVEPVVQHGAGDGTATRNIWERQVEHFWNITWVVGDDPGLLDSRKFWRTHRSHGEPGLHCTMMGDYQELSGHHGPARQREFWDALRTKVGNLDLRDDERLCAIALIKRFLPQVSRKAIGKDLVNNDLVRWPSTLYVAAWPWIVEVCKSHPELAAAYADKVRVAGESCFGERHTSAGLRRQYPDARRFPALDGNFVFTQALGNDRATPLTVPEARGQLVDELETFIKAVGAKPSPFLALLLMDGDCMGALLREADLRGQLERATTALSDFARRVPSIINAHEGYTVYTGGDDVLALVPLPTAMDAALALRAAYMESFDGSGLDSELRAMATISAALVFSHYRRSLRGLLARAHELLDHVAKEQTGRSSVAMAIHKSSGETATWSVPWDYLCTSADASQASLHSTRLGALMMYIDREHPDRSALGKSMLYRLRAQLGRMTAHGCIGPGTALEVPDGFDVTGLIAAELRTNRERDDQDSDIIVATARVLHDATRCVRRSGNELVVHPCSLTLDSAMIAYFLATQGRDEEEERP